MYTVHHTVAIRCSSVAGPFRPAAQNHWDLCTAFSLIDYSIFRILISTSFYIYSHHATERAGWVLLSQQEQPEKKAATKETSKAEWNSSNNNIKSNRTHTEHSIAPIYQFSDCEQFMFSPFVYLSPSMYVHYECGERVRCACVRSQCPMHHT